jgi:hypothetical protein
MDACLMSNLEVAYQVRPFVNYIVASEANEPFDGWPYDDVLGKLVANPDITAPDLGEHIVDAYVASYGPSSTVTQSALDLSKVDTIVDPLDDLADALIAHMPHASSEVWDAQRKATGLDRQHTLWDIAHLCEELGQATGDTAVRKAAKGVRNALKSGTGNFIVTEAHCGNGVKDCGGATIYLPLFEVSRFYADLAYAEDHRWAGMLSEIRAV